MMRRTPNGVTLEITEAQFEGLIMALGVAAGACADNRHRMYSWLRLANAINEGNPRWTPYEIPPDWWCECPACQRRKHEPVAGHRSGMDAEPTAKQKGEG